MKKNFVQITIIMALFIIGGLFITAEEVSAQTSTASRVAYNYARKNGNRRNRKNRKVRRHHAAPIELLETSEAKFNVTGLTIENEKIKVLEVEPGQDIEFTVEVEKIADNSKSGIELKGDYSKSDTVSNLQYDAATNKVTFYSLFGGNQRIIRFASKEFPGLRNSVLVKVKNSLTKTITPADAAVELNSTTGEVDVVLTAKDENDAAQSLARIKVVSNNGAALVSFPDALDPMMLRISVGQAVTTDTVVTLTISAVNAHGDFQSSTITVTVKAGATVPAPSQTASNVGAAAASPAPAAAATPAPRQIP